MTIPGRYGTNVVRYLEDGDTVEDAELYNGAIIQPVLDDGEYGILLYPALLCVLVVVVFVLLLNGFVLSHTSLMASQHGS